MGGGGGSLSLCDLCEWVTMAAPGYHKWGYGDACTQFLSLFGGPPQLRGGCCVPKDPIPLTVQK